MHLVRKILAFVLAWFFSIFIVITVVATAFNHTFTAGNVKKWLKENGIYENLVNQALKENKDQKVGSKSDNLSVNNPVIKKAFKKTFPPSLLQRITEEFIDGVEPWLKGKSDKPTFRIDLSDVKTNLANNVANAVKARYDHLPVCAAGVLPDTSNLLTINCRSTAVNIDRAVQRLVADIKASKDFLKDPVITADNLKLKDDKHAKAKPLFNNANDVPQVYHLLRISPYLFALLSLMTAGLLVFVSSIRRKGLRRIAVPLLSSSVILIIGTLIINAAFRRAEHELFTKKTSDQKILRENILPLLKDIKASLAHTVVIFAIIFLVISASLFVYLIKTRHNNQPAANRPAKS